VIVRNGDGLTQENCLSSRASGISPGACITTTPSLQNHAATNCMDLRWPIADLANGLMISTTMRALICTKERPPSGSGLFSLLRTQVAKPPWHIMLRTCIALVDVLRTHLSPHEGPVAKEGQNSFIPSWPINRRVHGFAFCAAL
jgi:hypothetical protein